MSVIVSDACQCTTQAYLAAAAAESVTAHGIVGKRALFTARSSTTGALLQPRT